MINNFHEKMNILATENTKNIFYTSAKAHPNCLDLQDDVSKNLKQIMVASAPSKWGGKNPSGTTKANAYTEKHGESPHIVPFFNFYYYWGLVPFKIVLNEGNCYILKKNKIQRVACALAHGLIFLSSFYVLANSFVLVAESDLSALIPTMLEFVSNLMDAILSLLLLNVFWRKEEQFLKMINHTIVSYNRTPRKQMRNLRIIVFLATMWITLTGTIVIYFLVTDKDHYMNESINVSSANFYSNLETAPNSNSPNVSSTQNYADKSFLQAISSIVMTVIFMYEFAIYPLTQGIFMAITLGLWQLGKDFEMDLQETYEKFPKSSHKEEDRIREGIKLYKELRETTEVIKTLFGSHLLAFCVTKVTYYAQTPYALLEKRGSVEKAMFAYFTQTTLSWFIAAEFHHHVKDVICKWIEVHLDCEGLHINTRLRLMSIFNQVNVDPIALQNKYFIVTYNYVCSMLGLIVTYGMLIFQLQNGGGSNDASNLSKNLKMV